MPRWMSIWILAATAGLTLLAGVWLADLSDEYVNTKIHVKKEQCNRHIKLIKNLCECK